MAMAIALPKGKHIEQKVLDVLAASGVEITREHPLSIKATQLASKVDTIIIMSGDSDYVELVTHLKSEGVRVEIAAVKETTAKILIEEADYFHPITQEDWFVYNPGPAQGRNKEIKRK